MAEEEANENTEEETAGDGGGSKKKLLIIGIAVFVLLAGGGAGAFFFMEGEDKPADAEQAEANPETKNSENAEGDAKGDKSAEEEKAEGKDGASKKEGDPEKGEDKEAEAKAASDKEEEEESFGMGRTFTFKPFHVNLGNPLENHYARIEVALEYATPKAEKELGRRKAQLRDAIVSIVSNKTREFLLNPDGKEHLRSEILLRINRYMKNKIEQVFITDMLIE